MNESEPHAPSQNTVTDEYQSGDISNNKLPENGEVVEAPAKEPLQSPQLDDYASSSSSQEENYWNDASSFPSVNRIDFSSCRRKRSKSSTEGQRINDEETPSHDLLYQPLKSLERKKVAQSPTFTESLPSLEESTVSIKSQFRSPKTKLSESTSSKDDRISTLKQILSNQQKLQRSLEKEIAVLKSPKNAHQNAKGCSSHKPWQRSDQSRKEKCEEGEEEEEEEEDDEEEDEDGDGDGEVGDTGVFSTNATLQHSENEDENNKETNPPPQPNYFYDYSHQQAYSNTYPSQSQQNENVLPSTHAQPFVPFMPSPSDPSLLSQMLHAWYHAGFLTGAYFQSYSNSYASYYNPRSQPLPSQKPEKKGRRGK